MSASVWTVTSDRYVRPRTYRACARGGGSGLVRVGWLIMQPHMEVLTQHVRGTLGVPGGGLPVAVKTPLQPGSGVTSISEILARLL